MEEKYIGRKVYWKKSILEEKYIRIAVYWKSSVLEVQSTGVVKYSILE